MQTIKLTQNKVAIVDDEDFTYLNQWKWYARKDRHCFYAQRKFKSGEKWKNVMMHRFIIKPPNDMFIDHINRNGLDNRKKNLRIVTHSQNHFNEKIRTDNTSGHKGVYWHTQSKRWTAVLGNTHLGRFKTIRKAIECRNHWFNKIF